MKARKATCRTLSTTLALVLVFSLALGLAGCTSTPTAPAATVNGTDIAESTVTAYIDNFRATSSLEDDGAWAAWLTDNGYTPQSVREEVVDYYVDQELTRQAAQERGVSVDAAKLDESVQKAKEGYGSEEAWKEALESSNTTEEAYREQVELSLLKEALAASFDDAEGTSPNDAKSSSPNDAEGTSPESSASLSAYSEWYTAFKEKAVIVVNPLPEGASYNKSAS